MSSATAVTSEISERWGEAPQAEPRPAAILKGGPRGLEIIVDGGAAVDAIAAALVRRLEEAPGFFRGSDVRVRVDGTIPAGCLARLVEIAARFELAIVEVGPRKPASAAGAPRRDESDASAPVPQPAIAAGTAPTVGKPVVVDAAAPEMAAPEVGPTLADPAVCEAAAPVAEMPAPAAPVAAAPATEPPATEAAAMTPAAPAAPAAPATEAPATVAAAMTPAVPTPAAPAAPAQVALEAVPEVSPSSVVEGSAPMSDLAIAAPVPERTRMVVGPVRSGVILDHPGNLVVVGDVNPGAEVRAQGNIVILGRLRGIAHAGIGRESGFILALRLEPQQLRIGRVVARASDQEAHGNGTEIAHVTDKTIVVERYAGKLPSGLAAGI